MKGSGSEPGTRDADPVPGPHLHAVGQSCAVSPLPQEESQQAHKDETQEDTNNGPGDDPWGKEAWGPLELCLMCLCPACFLCANPGGDQRAYRVDAGAEKGKENLLGEAPPPPSLSFQSLSSQGAWSKCLTFSGRLAATVTLSSLA